MPSPRRYEYGATSLPFPHRKSLRENPLKKMLPEGTRTRRISAAAAGHRDAERCPSTCQQNTASNEPSENGSAAISPQTALQLCVRTRETAAGEISTPTASQPRASMAASVLPLPQPHSRTRLPAGSGGSSAAAPPQRFPRSV